MLRQNARCSWQEAYSHRKTGITIPDTGVRDEHGFEPMSQLFSSPQRPSPPKEPAGRKTRSSTTDRNREHEQNIDGTSGIAAQTSLQAQKTPRLPPPKSQTPRHTNIGGSPVRHSSVKPTSPFRVMQDSNTTPTRAQSEVIRSIERDPSPVQARTAANARAGRPRKSIFDVNLSPEKITPQAPSSPPPGAIEEVSQILDTNDHEVADTQIPELDNSLPNLTDSSAVDPSPRQINTGEPNTKRKRERARRSDVSTTSAAAETSQVSSEPRSSAKRRRINMDTSQVEPSPSQATRSATRQANSASRASLERVEASQEQLEDDAPLPPVDDTQDVSHPTLRSSPAKRGRNKRKSVGLPSSRRRNASAAASRTSQPKKSRAQRESTARTSNYSAEATSGDEDEEGTTRMGSIRLRSATPAQDEGARITRSGRASIKPLAWWKNESYVYRNGSIDGVIRAEELPPEKRRGTVPRGRRGGRRKTGRLDTIEEEGEEEEHEDLLPEAWEEDLKVIRGPVRAWDRELGAGGVDEVEEGMFSCSFSLTYS